MGLQRFFTVLALLVVLSLGGLCQHLVDNWTVTTQNEVAIAQVNGGDVEFGTMRSTHEFLGHLQTWTWPIFGVVALLILVTHGRREYANYNAGGDK